MSHAITSDIRWALGPCASPPLRSPMMLHFFNAPHSNHFQCSFLGHQPISYILTSMLSAVCYSIVVGSDGGIREECCPWPLLVMLMNTLLWSGGYNRLSGWSNGNGRRSSLISECNRCFDEPKEGLSCPIAGRGHSRQQTRPNAVAPTPSCSTCEIFSLLSEAMHPEQAWLLVIAVSPIHNITDQHGAPARMCLLWPTS